MAFGGLAPAIHAASRRHAGTRFGAGAAGQLRAGLVRIRRLQAVPYDVMVDGAGTEDGKTAAEEAAHRPFLCLTRCGRFEEIPQQAAV